MQMENPSRQRSLIILNVVRGGRKCISLFANEIKLLAWQSVCSSVSPSICLSVPLSVCLLCCPCSSSDWFSSAVQFSNQPVEALWCFAELETRQKLRASENVSRFDWLLPLPFPPPLARLWISQQMLKYLWFCCVFQFVVGVVDF